ncbi:hypothetical protein IMZ48_00850 [Candidatus Bathyarchaeota archaeon]|nr:hypothetical protein [Candidatus Bathyarchaeota archaeon]
MGDEKTDYPDEDFNKIVKDLWAFAREHGGKSWELWPLSVLVRSVERLKKSTDENLKAVEALKASLEKNEMEAIRFSRIIKNLTWALVGLTVVLVLIALFVR